jgi:hypothetical protein
MKKLFVGLCLISSVANAYNLAWMPNKANGKIVLTNEPCKDNKSGKTYSTLNRIFMYTSEGYTMEGCFYITDDLVNAVWSNGQEMKYEIMDFTLYEKVAKEYKY